MERDSKTIKTNLRSGKICCGVQYSNGKRHFTQPAILPNTILPSAILPNTNYPMPFDLFVLIIRLQISRRYYKDDLKYLCGQYNPMFGCDSFI